MAVHPSREIVVVTLRRYNETLGAFNAYWNQTYHHFGEPECVYVGYTDDS